LPEEKITLNSVNPNVVRTNISTGAFYDQVQEKNLLAPIEGVVDTFESLLGSNNTSGECFEIGPDYSEQGAVPRKGAGALDDKTGVILEMLYHRGHSLHTPH
jgi:hypothetical protein